MKNNVHTLTFYPDVHCEKIMTEVFPEERLEFVASGGAAVASAPADFSVEDGKSYIVKFDCVDHEVEAANGAIANDVFSISVSGGQMSVSIAAAGSHTVSVTTCEKNICKMPEEYLPEGSGGGVSSWNDLTDKPFYSEVSVEEVLAEQEYTQAYSGEGIYLGYELPLVGGAEYVVTYNGMEYKCIAFSEPYNSKTHVLLGDYGELLGGESTGEPFVIEALIGFGETIIHADDLTFTISISQKAETIKTIGPKYLPEALRFGAVESYEVLVPEERLSFNNEGFIEIPVSTGFRVGDKVVVNWDSQKYEVVAFLDGEDVVAGNIGIFEPDKDTGEPFFILSAYVNDEIGWLLTIDTGKPNTSALVSIEVATETIKTIDPKFIVLTSPNGTKYNLSVSDDGTLSAVAT